jgi:periplasmic protein TonB
MTVQMDFEPVGTFLAWPRFTHWRGPGMLAISIVRHTDRIRWSGSAVFAVAAHAAVAASFLLGPQVKVIAAPPPAAVEVDLVAPPSSTTADASATPIGPDQVQAEAQPEPTPEPVEVPKFEPPPLEKIAPPDPVVLRKIDPKPKAPRPQRPQLVADRTTARPTNEAKLSNVAAAPRSGAPSSSPSDAEQSWEQQILARIEREKRYPSEAQQQGMEDYVTVRFVVDREGKVISARITHSNGLGPLDQEALAVFRRVSFAPPPSDALGQTFDRQVRLHFFPPRHG